MRFGVNERTRGSSIIEFALTAMIFFVIVFSIIELCLIYWVSLTMQHAVREGARYAVTGRSESGVARWTSVIDKIQSQSMGLYDLVHPQVVTYVNGVKYQNPNPGSPPVGMFGTGGDIVVLELNCSWPLLTPVFQKPSSSSGYYHFSVAATMRNESF